MLDHKIITFLEVCEQRNLTKAAESLFITQPAVTQQIKALEQHYGCKLFGYEGKKLVLTSQAKELYHYAIAMKVNQQKVEEQISLSNQQKVKIAFGATLTLGEFVLPPLVIEFLKEFPQVELHMQVDNTSNLLEQLKKGEIDFAFLEGYYSKETYDIVPFFEDSFIGVCSGKHPLAKQTVSFEELYAQRLIVREKGSGTREVLERALSLYNSSIKAWELTATIGNMSAIKEMVKENIGITFMYESAVRKELAEQSLCKIQIKEFHVKREYSCVSLRDSNLTNKKYIFLNYIKKEIRKHNGD